MGKTKRILSVCLGIMLTIVSLFTWNAVGVRADAPAIVPVSGISITVSFRADNADKGDIFYSSEGGQNWQELFTKMEPLN